MTFIVIGWSKGKTLMVGVYHHCLNLKVLKISEKTDLLNVF